MLQYHPPFVTALSPDELVGVLAHEVMHCALAHPARRQGRDAERWNVACDLAINPLLVRAGIVLPASRLMPGEGAYAGLQAGKSADEFYALDQYSLDGFDRRDGEARKQDFFGLIVVACENGDMRQSPDGLCCEHGHPERTLK